MSPFQIGLLVGAFLGFFAGLTVMASMFFSGSQTEPVWRGVEE
jgi:hypothetical protein